MMMKRSGLLLALVVYVVVVVSLYAWGAASGRLRRARQMDLEALERRVEALERRR